MPDNHPDTGLEVVIILSDGSREPGYWDGRRWLVGQADSPVDLPLDPAMIVGWEPL